MPVPTANFRSIGALSCFLLAVLLGLWLDLWTKQVAFERLSAGPPYRVTSVATGRQQWVVDTRWDLVATRGLVIVPNFLNFNVTVNEGAVFGFGQGQRWIFVAISIAAIAFLAYLFATSGRQRFYQIVLGILLAGVLGNMYDRIKLGYVRDMIYALPKWGAFPYIFNVADTLLCVGVGLVFVHSLLQSRRKPPVAHPAAPPPGA